MNPKDYYRKEALESLSSPEQIDKVIVVTDTRGWMSLIAIIAILVVFIYWSIYGYITDTVNGEGILINKGGRYGVFTLEPGIVNEIKINLYDKVKEGQELIVMSQPKTEYEIQYREGELQVLKGYMDPSEKEKMKIKELEYNISQIKQKYELSRVLKSPIDGTVTSILVADKGDPVEENTSIVTVEPEGPLSVTAYLPLNSAKNIKPGMKVNISPSTVKQEEYGLMEGAVTFVRSYPSDKERMLLVLKNYSLVELFSKYFPAVEIDINLEEDPNTVSKYKWTSLRGPDIQLSSGTLCNVTVITRETHPIELIFPGDMNK